MTDVKHRRLDEDELDHDRGRGSQEEPRHKKSKHSKEDDHLLEHGQRRRSEGGDKGGRKEGDQEIRKDKRDHSSKESQKDRGNDERKERERHTSRSDFGSDLDVRSVW